MPAGDVGEPGRGSMPDRNTRKALVTTYITQCCSIYLLLSYHA